MKPDFDFSYFSKKCRLLSFLAAIAVVAIHSDCTFVLDNPARWNVFVENLFCQRLSKWAVPFFFLISGVWFARSSYAKGAVGYLQFLVGKVKSLVLPWWLFAIVAMIVLTPLIIVNNHIGHLPLFERTIVASNGVWDAVNSLLGITIPEPKWAGYLWYVRTLFILFLFAPVWRLLLKLSPWMFLVGFLTLKAFSFDIPSLYFGAAHTFFLGICLGAFGDSVLLRKRVPSLVAFLLLAMGMALAVMWAGKDAGWWSVSAPTRLWGELLPILLGCGIWFSYDVLADSIPENLPECVKWSMWVYLFHRLFAAYFLAGMRFVLGKSDAVTVALPFVNLLLTMAVCIGLGYFLHRKCPKVFAVCCGGRG